MKSNAGVCKLLNLVLGQPCDHSLGKGHCIKICHPSSTADCCKIWVNTYLNWAFVNVHQWRFVHQVSTEAHQHGIYIYSLKGVELEALFKILVDTCWSVYFSISIDSEKSWSRSTVQVYIFW